MPLKKHLAINNPIYLRVSKLGHFRACASLVEFVSMMHVVGVGEEVKATRAHLEHCFKEKFEESQKQSQIQHDLMSKQINNLTGMMQHLLKAKAGFIDGLNKDDDEQSEISPAQNAKQQAENLDAAMSSDEVRNVMGSMPMPSSEVRRTNTKKLHMW